MKMRVFLFLALALCACATEVPEKETAAEAHNTEKRQTQEGIYSPVQYRTVRKQEQVAPVEEPQDDDKGIRNRTSSLQPISEDQSSNVERSPREQSSTEQSTTASGFDQAKSGQEIQKQVNVEVVGNIPQQTTPQISVEHRGLSLEDRRRSHIPPPQDGKSYTPEEFTSLIVSGFAVTPIPDYGYGLPHPGLINPLTTVAPPTPLPLVPVPGDLPVPGSLPPIHPLREQALRLNQARLLGHFRQSLETLPPPKNHRFYTPDEFNALLAAGYPITAVPVNALSYGVPHAPQVPHVPHVPQPSRSEAEEYRPGQVFSLNAQELLELQPERKAPIANGQLLQQLYANPQQEHKQNLQHNLQHNLQQNLQQIYYLEPQQQGRQVPSHTVIARPHYNFNGGEASVGAALSVSDTGASSTGSFDQELLALLGQPQVRPELQAEEYSAAPQRVQSTTVRSVAPQYQQVDRYVAKPSKKSSKLRSKVHVSFPQATEAPQQYLIETTNVQQQQQQQPQQQYRPTSQPQRLAQALRYVPIAQQAEAQPEFAYERPEAQGLKIVPAPKLQQLRPQQNYRVATSQYQQQEASPKQYRIIEVQQPLRPQAIRQELRLPSSSVERPVAYLKRYPELEKQRSVKIYDPVAENGQQQAQLYGEQFVLRPVYRTNDQQRQRYEAPTKAERVAEPTKAPHSSIYVSKNIPAPRKLRPQPTYREQQAEVEQVNIEQHGRNLDEQRSLLPPPKNNKAYTPEEFAALVAAGYSVTPVPVSAANLEAEQSRIEESVTPQPKRRLAQRRRNQYLPVRDDAP